MAGNDRVLEEMEKAQALSPLLQMQKQLRELAVSLEVQQQASRAEHQRLQAMRATFGPRTSQIDAYIRVGEAMGLTTDEMTEAGRQLIIRGAK